MARSADRRAAAGLGLLALAGVPLLGGCESTFTQNARAKLAATRSIESRDAQLVRRPSKTVDVTRAAIVRDRRSAAVVVRLTSRATSALTDVPVTVGVRRDGEDVPLNDAPELPWFSTHVPVVAASAETTWVVRFTGRAARAARSGAVYAVVGDPAPGAAQPERPMPRIEARVLATGKRAVSLHVRNTSEIPQTALQVAAVADGTDGPAAAGSVTIPSLGRGASSVVRVPLTGRPGDLPITVIATPSIFS